MTQHMIFLLTISHELGKNVYPAVVKFNGFTVLFTFPYSYLNTS